VKLPALSSLTQRIALPQAKAWEITNRAIAMDASGADIIHLGIGDPDMDTHPSVVNALHDSIKQGRTHYPPLAGEAGLRTEIARHCSNFYARDVTPDQVTVFPGVQSALYASFQCLVEAGDEVILLQPTYATYPAVIESCGATIVYAPLNPADDFRLDIALIESLISPRTKAILINSPSNPSGMVFSKNELQSLLKVCQYNNMWLVADEVYADLVFDGEFASPYNLTEAHNCVVVLRSLSKSHAMTGWRIGWTISPLRLAESLENLSQAMLFGVSQFIQDAAVVALQNSHLIVPQIRQTFLERRDRFCAQLKNIPGLKVYRPKGGMFALVDVSALGHNGESFANLLLNEAGISVVPGFAFGDSVLNCVRIGLSQDIQTLDKAAARIEQFVQNLQLKQKAS